MKKFPYIGKANGSGNLYVVHSDTCGYGLHDNNYHQQLNTRMFEDVTREYLNGNCIKVESPEHMEYVQEIAKRYGWWWYSEDKEEKVKTQQYIYFFEGDCLYRVGAGDHGWEEIFIPLPTVEQPVNEQEWKVGDEVSLRYKYDSKGIHCTGKLLYLSDKHIILEDSNGSDIHKLRCDYDIEVGLSEEELLLNSLEYDIQTSIDRGDTAYGVAYNLLQEYSITKKPQ